MLYGTKFDEKYVAAAAKSSLSENIQHSNGSEWMKKIGWKEKVTCSLHSIFLLIVKSISDAKWHVEYENIVNGFGV